MPHSCGAAAHLRVNVTDVDRPPDFLFVAAVVPAASPLLCPTASGHHRSLRQPPENQRVKAGHLRGADGSGCPQHKVHALPGASTHRPPTHGQGRGQGRMAAHRSTSPTPSCIGGPTAAPAGREGTCCATCAAAGPPCPQGPELTAGRPALQHTQQSALSRVSAGCQPLAHPPHSRWEGSVVAPVAASDVIMKAAGPPGPPAQRATSNRVQPETQTFS